MEYQKGYRSSHQGDTAVRNYLTCYSGFRKGIRIVDRFSYARWLIEQEELSLFFDRDAEAFSQRRYLDFACGTGRLISFLEERFGESMGVDISDEMLSIARKECNRSELISADITEDDVLGGQKFDVVTAFRFFLRAEDSLRRGVFQKIHELMADDGLFVFNIHDSKRSLNWPLYLMSRLTGKESPVPGCFDLGYRPEFPERDVLAMLEEYGFSVEKVVYLGVVPNMLYGLPMLSVLYYKLDRFLYRRQWLKGLSIERIYYCRKVR